MADIHNFCVCISFNILWQNRLLYTAFRVNMCVPQGKQSKRRIQK
nr:MAG TPA: hypothetical protein [Caudoviricetes sp.]DAH39444.1 MAG TPA: hypothetical protein [Caudoviricetes sp.]DAM26042.1 MAG TPA: hypothetical protein [Caudoviricetes sp.]